ncbi:carbohydrate ABC transporter permease [Pseudonocardia sp. DLS-67]
MVASLDHEAPPRGIPPGPAPRRRLKLSTRNTLLGIVMILPAVITMIVVVAYPLVFGVSLGFFDVRLLTLDRTFVGLENFVDVLTGDAQFVSSLWINTKFAVATVIVQTVVGIGMALLLNRVFFGRSVARGIVLFPYLVPVIAATTVWRWMMDESNGLLNYLIITLGISDEPIGWLSTPNWAMFSLILVASWRLFPFVLIAVLGRLQNIPRELYEAAWVDGASRWQTFWHITLPQLRSVLIVTVFLRFIWDFNDFDIIALMTGGGPARSTETLPFLIYSELFNGASPGVAAAIADLVLVILAAFFALYFWVVKPNRDR